MRKLQAIALGTAGLATAFALTACSSSTSTPTSDPTPSENQSFSLGDTTVNTGGQLPSYWPSDVPTPKGLPYIAGAQLPKSVSANFNGASPSVAEVSSQLDADFKAQGWTSEANFGGGASGGVTSWKKGNQTAQVIIANEKGTTVNITVVTTS